MWLAYFFGLKSGDTIHSVCGHIVVKHFAVVLLFFLNVVEDFADVFVAEFEDASIIEMGRVLFNSQSVGTQILVVLHFGGLPRVGCGKCGHGFAAARHGRNGAGTNLIERVQMLPFGLRHLGKEIFQLRIGSALGMLGVHIDAELFLILHVFEKARFFLG